MGEDLKKKGEENKFSSSPIDISRELEECEKKAAEYLAGWQRGRADFLNYKKEEMERIGELLKYANEEFVLKILPILDNFEIIEKKLPENLKNDENPEGEPSVPYGASVKGFLQIKRQLENFLKSLGAEEIKSVGEKFDPQLHEVVEEVELKDNDSTSSPQEKSGIIVEEIQKGYKISGHLLRPAKVKIVK